MFRRLFFFRHARLLTAIAVLPLAACQQRTDDPLAVTFIGSSAGLFAEGPRLSNGAQAVRAATTQGLVGFDDQGRVIPALAERWIVTDDGTSYIFRLRDGAWPGGVPLAAETVRAALQRAFASVKGTALGQELSVVEDVRAMAGRVVEIRLAQPAPDFLQVLAQPELGLAHTGRGAGPMRMTRQRDGAMLTALAPSLLGQPQPDDWRKHVRPLQLTAKTAPLAVAAFANQKADIVLGGTYADRPLVAAAGVARGAVRHDTVSGLFGLVVAHTDGFLSLAENREALAMAINREALARMLDSPGWVATTRIVAPGVADDTGTVSERWPGQSIAERQREAAIRVAHWRRGGKRDAPVVRIALPDGAAAPGGRALFARLAEDFAAIGVTARRVDPDAAADLRLIDSVARSARIGWYLDQLSCAAQPAACSPAVDRMIDDAAVTSDPAKRADLLGAAEAQLLKANTYLPLGMPVRWSLVGPRIIGFATNPWGIHPLMPLARRPK